MIFIQISFLIIFVYFVMSYSYLLITPGFLLSNNTMITFIKKLSQTLTTTILTTAFKTDFYMNQPYEEIKEKMNENLDKIDIIVCNHMSTVDWLLIMTYLQKFNISGINLVLRKGIVYWPGFGLTMYANTDIKVDRHWETDQKNLGKQLNEIKTGNEKQVIIIFPEGTRFTPEKLEEAHKYANENNIPIYNNVLIPKTKGTWFIVNHLAKTNRLGRIWDITLVSPKFINKTAYLEDIFGKELGPLYADFRELQLIDNFPDLEIFRKWFLENWKIKDEFFQKYKDLQQFEKLTFRDNKYNHLAIITTICTIFTIFLTNKWTRYYLLGSLLLAYILIIFKL